MLPPATMVRPQDNSSKAPLLLASGIRSLRSRMWGLLLLAVVLAPSQSSARVPQTYALLVGVTEYRSLDRRWWLKGPENDVGLMAAVLESAPFSVPLGNIVRLTGWPATPAGRPTRANIEGQFRRLADVVQPGDQVFVLMAGHGSQQPANVDSLDDEPDGLDEIFLPADASGWDGTKGRVAQAIVDDEMHAWVTAIRNKGALVWLVVDSCQSGTMVRGGGAEVERRVPLGVLVPELAATTTIRRGTAAATPRIDLAPGAGGLVALYAAQPFETTPEKRLPTSRSPYHGLFTYTLAAVLSESRSALTYRELADRVISRYRSEGRFGPTPMLEGDAVDAPVLGAQRWPTREDFSMEVRPRGREWLVQGGTVTGLTPGTVLTLVAPRGSSRPGRVLGHVRLTSVQPLVALAEPISYKGMPAPRPVPLEAGTRARVATYGRSGAPLRLAVQSVGPGHDAVGRPVYRGVAEGRGPAALELATRDLTSRTKNLARRTELDDEADWVLRLSQGQAVLLPGGGWYADAAGGSPGGAAALAFTLGDEQDAALADKVADALQKVARARALLSLATVPRTGADMPFEIELVRFRGGAPEPVPVDSGGRTLHADDVVAFRLTNRSTHSLDISLFHVDSGYGVTQILPTGESVADGRFPVGESRLTGRFVVGGDAVEFEQVVAIALKSSDPPVGFDALGQAPLSSAGVVRRADRGIGNEPNEGFIPVSAVRMDPSVRLLAWRVVP